VKSSPHANLRLAVIPLLFETHWDAEYDIICTVRSDKSLQIARLVEKRGYTREEADARLAAQLPVEEKAAKSHYVINNNGSAEELTKQVVKFIEWLKKQSKGIP
jgi:dephospho-CoA kinase